MKKSPAGYLFAGQLQHLLLLACLLPGALWLAAPALEGGKWLGIADRDWLAALLSVTVAHQALGWFVFRTQLVFGLFTRLFGKRDLDVWGLLFLPFLLTRPLLTLALGLSDPGSLGLSPWIAVPLGLLLLLPAGYTGWSVNRYFGFRRALGGDHFREEYRRMPLVKEGVFKYNSNAMYAFAFLALWAIALFTGSLAALAAALFQHAYIWVHMYCTEEPDMRVIYGNEAWR